MDLGLMIPVSLQLQAEKDCHCDPVEKRGKQSLPLKPEIASPRNAGFQSSQ